MTSDYQMLRQGVASLGDFQKLQQEFEMKKQAAQADLVKAQSGGNLPAALQIANEYAKARAAGDTQRMNDIALSAKSFDKGVIQDANGNIVAMGGYGDAVGQIAGTRKAYEAQAQNASDLAYDPLIAGGEAAARLGQQLQYEPQIQTAVKSAESRAGTQSELNERIASMPQLEQTVRQLSDLGKVATYTKAGQFVDVVRRETGQEPRESAIARKEYISLVDNQILPLLRQTFGAQFTQKEGESLKVTLGDPNATPEEKDAVLRSFIEQKKATIETMQRQIDPLQASRDAIDRRNAEGFQNPNQTLPNPYARAEQEFKQKTGRGGLPPDKQKRLQELRAKRDAGTLQ